jgi:hypothetical protein
MEAAMATGDALSAGEYPALVLAVEELGASEAGLAQAMIASGMRVAMRSAVRRPINAGAMNPGLLEACQEHFAARAAGLMLLKAWEMENAVMVRELAGPGTSVPEFKYLAARMSRWQQFLMENHRLRFGVSVS